MMEKKNFFRNENERNLWIRLNAERIQYSIKIKNNEDAGLGSLDKPHSCMWISRNQLDYDEHKCDALRVSLEEMLLLTASELFRLFQKREEEKVRKMFEQCSSDWDNDELK